MNFVRGLRNSIPQKRQQVCWFYTQGICRFGHRCRNLHIRGEEIQHQPSSKHQQPKIPTTPERLRNQTDSSAAPSTSQDEAAALVVSTKSCGICFDTIMEKTDIREQTFGILPNCNHCFCFACIRRWRQTKEFDVEVSKACPECRKPSDYVYPSRKWFEHKEEKELFIERKKNQMQSVDCRYFKKGNGHCPFGNNCLYLHALSNGSKVDVGPPRPRRRRPSHIESQVLHELLYWFNDDELFMEDEVDDDDDDDDYEVDLDSELDLDDPTVQYFDHGDIRRYMAMDGLMNSDPDSDGEDVFLTNLMCFP